MIDKLSWVAAYPEILLAVMACVIALVDLGVKSPKRGATHVLTLLTLLGSWNDFAWPLIALKDNDLFTLPIGMLYLKNQTAPDYNSIMALALISVLPMVLLFLGFQRYFVQGFARTGIK